MNKILRITNLAAETTESQLSELCGKFGRVSNVRVVESPYSGVSRGFGFVEMESDEEAAACMTGLNASNDLVQKLSVSSSSTNPFKKTKRRI